MMMQMLLNPADSALQPRLLGGQRRHDAHVRAVRGRQGEHVAPSRDAGITSAENATLYLVIAGRPLLN